MTAIINSRPLKWSAQFNVVPIPDTPSLRGDRVILPSTALEELLAAANTRAADTRTTMSSNFDPQRLGSSSSTKAAERQRRSEAGETHQDLPHPLTFRLVNPENDRVIFAGIREFSAKDGHVVVSPFLRQALGLRSGTSEGETDAVERLTIHAQELPKGTYVKIRPLEGGYDPEDWKALLEKYLRDNFTTLTRGEILTVTAGREEYQFFVDAVEPEALAISVVDTDLMVDIEPLSEEQAKQTWEQRLQKTRSSQTTPGGRIRSSTEKLIDVGQEVVDDVLPGQYVDYTLGSWGRGQDLLVDLTIDIEEDDLDLFISPAAPRYRARPRQEAYVYADFSTGSSKRIRIDRSDSRTKDAEALWISVRGYATGRDPRVAMSYGLRIIAVSSPGQERHREKYENGIPSPNPDETRCNNCQQWVPAKNLMLHENFCFRNNVLCSQCSTVFQKGSSQWKDHWHCSYDNTYGSNLPSHAKHDLIFHTPQACADCGYEAQNTPALAQHRTQTCPAKQVLCTFCHLLVPQRGPEDPDPGDPEVIVSGLTPHEFSDGARTTECHLCARIVRLRDMTTHLKHHDLQRLSRAKPRSCRNTNCGRTLDTVNNNGDLKVGTTQNDVGLCNPCYGPLYVAMYDPEGKGIRRRVERRYLTQLMTGCGQDYCRNEYCKSGLRNRGLENQGQLSSKEAMAKIRPILEGLKDFLSPLHFCTDLANQRRATLARTIAAGDGLGEGEKGDFHEQWREGVEGKYDYQWCVAALELQGGNLDKAQQWLKDYAPTIAESARSATNALHSK